MGSASSRFFLLASILLKKHDFFLYKSDKVRYNKRAEMCKNTQDRAGLANPKEKIHV